MPLATMISLAFFAAMIFYFFLGVQMLSFNRHSSLHRVFFVICMALSTWAFTFSISNSAPTHEVCLFWRMAGAFGWGVFYSLLLHFSLILTEREKILKKKWIYAAIYLPALGNLFAFCLYKEFAVTQYNLVETYAGWINVSRGTFWDMLFNIYYISFSLASIILIFLWGRRSKKNTVKRQSSLIVVSYIAALIMGSFTEIIINAQFNIKVPQLAPIVIVIPITVMLYCIKKYELLPPGKEKQLAARGQILSEHTRSRLFTYLAMAFILGSFLNFATQYLIFRAPLGEVLVFSTVVFTIALVLLAIQQLKVKVVLKDIISFTIISLTYPCAVYFGYIETAATTMWSVVFILILVAVVFNRRNMLIIIGSVAVITLIGVWIVIPSHTMTIHTTDHVSRLVILLAFLWIAFFVNRVYVRRLAENENQMRIQQLQTATSVILDSVNENDIADKMSEVLYQCGAYLEAEQGYVLIFGNGSKSENTVFEWCDRGIRSIGGSIATLTAKSFPLWADKIVSGQSDGIFLKNIDALPEGKAERRWMEENKLHSMMIMPLANKDKLIGVWGFITIKKEKQWNMTHQNALMMVGNRITDIYLNIEAEKELIRMAYYDSMTGLPNRTLFERNLETALKSAVFIKNLVSVIHIDLDFFKTVNDFMGQKQGDALLCALGERLRQMIRRQDSIARYGGDEFFIMIRRAATVEEVIAVAKRIISSLQKPIKVNNQEISITVSMGVATAPVDGNTPEELIKNAGLALIESKKMGKNRCTVCTQEIKEAYIAENELSNCLYRALERQEFQLYYQPKVNAKTEEIVGLEALIRWQHPDKGLISPVRFIPLAEKMGLIGAIDQWVLKTACRQSRIWQDKGYAPLKMAVNFSLSQFYQESGVEKTALMLKETGLDPVYVEVEITESIAYYKSEVTRRILNGMREMGISVAIDDFGMEYSSLSRLHTLPVDRIKIDRHFVLELSKGRKGQDIMKTIFALSKALGLKTTVEGIETEEQLDFVKTMDCDEIQGYYYYKPMPADEIEKILYRLN